MAESIKAFGVVGSGIMGRGIAEVAATRGDFEKVILHDSEQGQLDSALKTIEKDLSRLAEKGKIDEAARKKALDRILATAEAGELARCGFVVEAVPEDLEIKGKVLASLGRTLAEGACIASNTSSIPITRLAACAGRPEKVIGMHFMNPVPRMKGLEIIKGLYTSQETCEATLALAARFGKQVTFSKDRAGFVINRILIPMLNDAVRGINAGISSVEAVDKYFKEDKNGPRHPMGPFMLADLIGLDTTQHILEVLEAELGAVFAPDTLLARMVDKGACGQKTGGGFYTWERGKAPVVSPLVSEMQKTAPAGDAAGSAAMLGKRAWLVMINEAVRVVEEGTSTAADVDRGCLYCLNHREGILAALDGLGISQSCADMEAMEERFGVDYKPAPLLRRLSEAGFGGREKGRGIYTWDAAKGAVAGPNSVLEEYLG